MNVHEEKGIFKATGANVYYETKGIGEHLLFIHAGIADSRMWDHEFHVLANHFCVVRLDLPGYGLSEFVGGNLSYNKMIHELLHHLRINKVHILGASFGGKIAIDYYLDHPESCLSLALLSPAIGGWKDSLFLQQFEKEEEHLLKNGKKEETALLNYKTWVLGGREPNAVDPKIKDLVTDMQMQSLTKPEPDAPCVEIEAEDSITKIKDIKIPLLLINGAYDIQDFRDISKFICKEIPSAQRLVLPDAGHLANLESPERFTEIVLNFFLKNTHRSE